MISRKLIPFILFVLLVLFPEAVYSQSVNDKEQLELDHGCALIISSAWSLISDTENYMDRPRKGNLNTLEPNLVYSEGPVKKLNPLTKSYEQTNEIHALPPDGDERGYPTRYTMIAAYRKFTYIDGDDPNYPAVVEAGEKLDKASKSKFGENLPDVISHSDAEEIYMNAFNDCMKNGREKLFVTTIDGGD